MVRCLRNCPQTNCCAKTELGLLLNLTSVDGKVGEELYVSIVAT